MESTRKTAPFHPRRSNDIAQPREKTARRRKGQSQSKALPALQASATANGVFSPRFRVEEEPTLLPSTYVSSLVESSTVPMNKTNWIAAMMNSTGPSQLSDPGMYFGYVQVKNRATMKCP